jgi:phosphoribosylanthranilate isomerase
MLVKICGIRDVESALAAAGSGADAIGLNFYAKSPRVVTPAAAADIVARLRGQARNLVEAVGVFVNHSVGDIREICTTCGLTMIQLHGDEPPEQVAELAADYRIVRAFRIGIEGLALMTQYLDACRRLRSLPWACLADARVEGQYGGTGHTAPWELLARDYRTDEWPRLILAGGLRPDNVAEAIRVVHPWGVDVAGGVESAVACKDAALVRQFVQNAKASP